MTLATQLLPWKSWQKTAIPSGAPVITPQEREAKRQAKIYFKNILQLGRNPLNSTKEEIKKAEAMLAVLGINYPIVENHTTSSLFSQMQKQQEESIFEKFQKAYKDPKKASQTPEYEKLFKLVDSEDSDAEKRETLYNTFERDPVAILVCISHPISQSKNTLFRAQGPYRLMEYIFQDAEAWKKIASHVLSHRENIGLFNVEKLFLPILQKALSLDFSDPKQESLVEMSLVHNRVRTIGDNQTKDSQLQARRMFIYTLQSLASFTRTDFFMHGRHNNALTYPSISATLLKEKTLISDWFIADCIIPYLSTFQIAQINMERALKHTSADVNDKVQQENTDSWIKKLLEAAPKGIAERSALLENQEALLEKAPWLMSNKKDLNSFKKIIANLSLTPEKVLDFVKDIIEVSGNWRMPYNHLWYSTDITNIDELCVELLLTVSDQRETLSKYIVKCKDTFVHSAASRGQEAIQIIEAISREPRLYSLLQECCNYTGNKGFPLEIALQEKNNSEIIDILTQHTDNLTILKRLIKTEHHADIKFKANFLILSSSYQNISDTSYRLLDSAYLLADRTIQNSMYHTVLNNSISLAPDNGRYVELKKTIEPASPIIQQVLADHLEYLEYLLKGAHTTLDDTTSKIVISPDNFKKALFTTITNKTRLAEIQNSPDKYPTLYWWTTLLPQASKPPSAILEKVPQKSSGWRIGFFGEREAAEHTSDNNNLLISTTETNPTNNAKYILNTSPIVRLESEVKKTMLQLFKEWQEEKALESSTPRLEHQGP